MFMLGHMSMGFRGHMAGIAALQVDGDLTVTGDATVTGASTLTGAVTASSTIAATGKITATGGLDSADNITLTVADKQILVPDSASASLPQFASSADADHGFRVDQASGQVELCKNGAARAYVAASGTNVAQDLLGTGGARDLSNWTNCTLAGFVEFTEMSPPGAAPVSTARVYADDDGTKTDLHAQFQTGAAQKITEEP